MSFNVGDKVKRLHSSDPSRNIHIGNTYTVTYIRWDGRYINVEESRDQDINGTWDVNRFELIKSTNKNNPMSIKSIYKNLTRKEPEKSFVKAGIMDQNDELTPEGHDLFIGFLLEQNKEAFNTTVVQPILKEQEEECK